MVATHLLLGGNYRKAFLPAKSPNLQILRFSFEETGVESNSLVMTRSIKKGFYVEPSLMKKVTKAQENGDRKPIKTWSRKSTITPDFVGLNFTVHNGKGFLPVYVTENMVGHKLGEFSATRSFKSHNPHTQK